MKKLNKMCQYFHNTDLFECPHCGKKLRDYYQELKDKCDAVPKEKKQELLNWLKKGNVGFAIEKVDPNHEIENNVWFTIIGNQIEKHEYNTFNFEAK